MFFILSNCFNKQQVSNHNVLQNSYSQDTLTYSNNIYKIKVHLKDKEINYFKLSKISNSEELQGTPELILINGEIPEGSLRQDYNNLNDYRGYKCDASYQYITKKIKIAFALEKNTKKRLDLIIYDSNNKNFANGNYTLAIAPN